MNHESHSLDDLLDDGSDSGSALDFLSEKPPAQRKPAYKRDEAIKRGHVYWTSEKSEATFEWVEAGTWFSESKSCEDFDEAKAWLDAQFERRQGTKGYSIPDLDDDD